MIVGGIGGGGGGGGEGGCSICTRSRSSKIIIQNPKKYQQHEYQLEKRNPEKFLTSTLARMVCVVATAQNWSICNY